MRNTFNKFRFDAKIELYSVWIECKRLFLKLLPKKVTHNCKWNYEINKELIDLFRKFRYLKCGESADCGIYVEREMSGRLAIYPSGKKEKAVVELLKALFSEK